MKSHGLSLKVIGGLALFAASLSSHAIPVVGSSGGSFSNLSSCDNSGLSQNCRIVSTSNGSSTQVQWGSTSSLIDFTNPSRLTSVDMNINTNTDSGSLGVAIARLDWFNSATRLQDDLNSFAVRWTLSLNFTAPTGGDPNGSEAFQLTINNPLNPLGDLAYGLGLADLSNLAASINLNGVTMSNLRYQVVDGSGTGTSTFLNNIWYNDENNNASLYILADFTRRPASVPEPATLALFGIGLLGTAAATRRRAARKS